MKTIIRIAKGLWAVVGTLGIVASAVLGYMTEKQRGILFEQIANRTTHIVSQDVIAVSGTADVGLQQRQTLVGLPFNQPASQYVNIDDLPAGAVAIKVVKVEPNEGMSTLDVDPGNLQPQVEIDNSQPRSVHFVGSAVREGRAVRHLRVFVRFKPKP